MPDRPRLSAVGAGEDPPGPTRARSTVSFPYADLAQVEELASRVARSLGECSPAQLAAWLGHSTLNSGAYRNKVAAARLFGVLDPARNRIRLSPLGSRLADPQGRREARVEAFLTVPLYRALYDHHLGRRLPALLGLELEMVRRGISPSQVKSARRLLMRSAGQAGFLEAGSHQLVLPAGCREPEVSAASTHEGRHRPPPAADSLPPRYPRMVEAVLEQAPWDGEWSREEFEEWADLLVRAARMHFRPGGAARETTPL